MATLTAGVVTTINSKEEWAATLGAATNDGKAVSACMKRRKIFLPVFTCIASRFKIVRMLEGGGGLFGDLVRPLPHDLSIF